MMKKLFLICFLLNPVIVRASDINLFAGFNNYYGRYSTLPSVTYEAGLDFSLSKKINAGISFAYSHESSKSSGVNLIYGTPSFVWIHYESGYKNDFLIPDIFINYKIISKRNWLLRAGLGYEMEYEFHKDNYISYDNGIVYHEELNRFNMYDDYLKISAEFMYRLSDKCGVSIRPFAYREFLFEEDPFGFGLSYTFHYSLRQ